MAKNFKTLIVFDDPSAIDLVLRYRHLKDIIVMPFSIGAKIACQDSGIEAYFQDELMELPDLNRIGTDNIKRVRNIAQFLDSSLQRKIGALKNGNFKFISASQYILKIFFDSIHASYYMLEALFKRMKAEEMIVIKTKCDVDEIIRGRGSIILALLENVYSDKKKIKNIKIIHWKKRSCPEAIIACLRSIKQYVKNFKFKIINGKEHRGNGIILNNGHDIPYLTKDILRNINFHTPYFNGDSVTFSSSGHSVVKIKRKANSDLIKKCIEEVFEEAFNDREYRELFIGDDDLFHFIHESLQRYVYKTLGDILPLMDDLMAWLSDIRPKMLITSDCRFGLEMAFLLEAARWAKAPIITYQEGGGAGFLNWPLFSIDADLSDIFLVYGEGAKQSSFMKGRANLVPVGSIRLETIQRNLKSRSNRDITIFFVPDIMKADSYQHYPYNGGIFSQAYGIQKKIIDILTQFKDIKFVIKTIKGREHFYKQFVNRFITIETRPLANVLGKADAFILDYPCTTLYECLLTDKPIAILYDFEAVDFEPHALASLRKRARMSSDQDEFYSLIQFLIEDAKSGSAMTSNSEFCRNYNVTEKTEENLRCFFDTIINERDKL